MNCPGGTVERICLPRQETQVQSLIQGDSTCCQATKPVYHNYWACTLETVLWNKRNCCDEKCVHWKEVYTLLATNKESPCKVTKTQHSHKIKKKKTKKLKSWIHQEYTLRHRSACRTPAESRQEYLTSRKEYIDPCKTRDQALSLWSGSTDSNTLDYQRTNLREYEIVRNHTKETSWIQDVASPNHQ